MTATVTAARRLAALATMGSALTATVLFAFAGPAQAAAGGTYVCDLTASGVSMPAGSAAPSDETIRSTGEIACFDAASNNLLEGTATVRVTDDDQVQGSNGVAVTQIAWEDGTQTTIKTVKHDIVQRTDGRDAILTVGQVTPDSTRFAGAVTHGTGEYVDYSAANGTSETTHLALEISEQ